MPHLSDVGQDFEIHFAFPSGKPAKLTARFLTRELLGKGTFSWVFRAYSRDESRYFAAKVYTGYDDTAHAWAVSERDCLLKLGQLGSPFFPKSPEGSVRVKIGRNNHPMLTLELGEYHDGELRQRIALADLLPDLRHGGAPARELSAFWEEASLKRWLLDLCDAVATMHQGGVIHRDIKPSNVLLKRDPGAEFSRPFLIDFNTSINLETGPSGGAGFTETYLPPEVRHGERTEPAPADDLWALALTIWHTLYGGADIDPGAAQPPPSRVFWLLTPLHKVLLKALSLDPTGRHPDARSFHQAVSEALRPPPEAEASGPSAKATMRSEQLAALRDAARVIRDDMVQTLEAGDFPVAKAVRERVATMLADISAEETQATDLASGLQALGPSALPVVFDNMHWVAPDSQEFDLVVDGALGLARSNPGLASECVDHFGASAVWGARALAPMICYDMAIFPRVHLERVVDEEGIFLPEERFDLADLCILYCREQQNAVITLCSYMCREYIANPQGSTYWNLRDRVASRLVEIGFPQTLKLLIEDTEKHVWESSDYARGAAFLFGRLPGEEQEKLANSLLQLYGDAFGAFGDEALEHLQRGKVPEFSKGRSGRSAPGYQLRIRRAFLLKLARVHEATHNWVVEHNGRQRGRRNRLGLSQPRLSSSASHAMLDDIQWVAKNLVGTSNESLNVSATLDRYLATGSGVDMATLRNLKNQQYQELFQKLAETLRSDETTPSAVLWVLKLLDRCRRFWGELVTPLILEHWDVLAGGEFFLLARIASREEITRLEVRNGIIDRLRGDRRDPARSVAANEALNRMLGHS